MKWGGQGGEREEAGVGDSGNWEREEGRDPGEIQWRKDVKGMKEKKRRTKRGGTAGTSGGV